MNKLIPLMLGLTLLSGSVAMAAPAAKVSSKTTHRTCAKKHSVKKVSNKKVAKTAISKK
jgi:hypothetical protein